MREIKFRAWDSERNIMKRPSVNMMIDTFNGTCYWQFGYDISLMGKLELMQYTGLKDKNGKEIYEGDILSPGYTNDELFVVVFDETKARFAEKRVSKEYPIHAGFIMDGSFLRSVFSSQRIEIIGNIHEHPELLNWHC